MNIVLNPSEPLILRDTTATRVDLLSLNSFRIEYPALLSIENDVEVYQVGSSEISFPALKSVGGDVAVRSNENLVSFFMSVVTLIQGRVLFEYNAVLNLIDMPALTVAVGGFLLRSNPAISIGRDMAKDSKAVHNASRHHSTPQDTPTHCSGLNAYVRIRRVTRHREDRGRDSIRNVIISNQA